MIDYSANPFNLENDSAYRAWREQKLSTVPANLDAITVEVGNLGHLRPTEKSAISAHLKNCNMVVYASKQLDESGKKSLLAFGRQFGLKHLDHNIGADDEGVTELEVKEDAMHRRYIPYSNRAIHWHTDGYYNTLEHTIRSFFLHCIAPAAQGGENALLDHELAYIHLRDLNPAYIQSLMQADAMTIPPNIVRGKQLRPARSGPVFSLDDSGHLHMRYTERARNILWKEDESTRQAVAALVALLHSDSPFIYRGTLQAGQGLLCNNVLHNRSGFENSETQTRLLYRLRYYDQIVP